MKKQLDGFKQLTPEERLTFLSDVSTLVWKGTLPVENGLALLLKVKGEEDTIVATSLSSKFYRYKHYMNAATEPAYEKFVRANLLPVKKKLGWEEHKNEEETVKDLRAEVISVLGTVGQDTATMGEAAELFAKYLKDKQSVSPNIIGSVLKIVAYNGGENEYEQIKTGWKKAANPQEEKRFLFALSAFRRPELAGKTLELALTPEVRATDSVTLLSALLSDKDTNDLAWKFVREHWNELSKKFPPRFNKRIAGSCSSFDTAEKEKELQSFFSTHPMEAAKSAVARMLEEVHVGVLYRQRNEELIRKWVSKQAEAIK
jgi:hypothetical protein